MTYSPPFCNPPARFVVGSVWFRGGRIGAGLWSRWSFRFYVLNVVLGSISVGFCLVFGSGVRCWFRRPLCFGYTSAVSGLSMGFPAGVLVWMLVAKPKRRAGEIEKS